MMENLCLNCGATLYCFNGSIKKFCNRKCQLEYGEKERQKQAEKAAERVRLRTTLIPEKQCRKCVYGYAYGGRYGCGYVFETDTPRLLLHPEGLTDKCYEYTPKKGRRTPRQPSAR